jgi:hypothetical protein
LFATYNHQSGLCFFFAEFMQTNDDQNDNLYPYVHLLPNNQLFIFANRDSILFDWTTNSVVANLPTIPGEPRNYPSAGSSAMLPLSGFNGWTDAEILLCGGSTYGAFLNPAAALPASTTCGRISPLDAAGLGYGEYAHETKHGRHAAVAGSQRAHRQWSWEWSSRVGECTEPSANSGLVQP